MNNQDVLNDWLQATVSNSLIFESVEDQEALIIAVMELTAQVKSVAEALWLKED